MDLWVREARIFKYGSGTGTNFSALRGEGEPLSGGGKSSGLMSFLKIGDRAAGAIKSGGTTRRAAKMVVLDLDHPDIEEFINWKVVEEQKVAALVTGSKLLNRHLNAILQGLPQLAQGRRTLRPHTQRRSAQGHRRRPRPPWCRPTTSSACLQLAKQGFTAAADSKNTTPTGTRRPTSPSPARTATTRCASTTTSWRPSQDDGAWHLYWRTEKEKARAKAAQPKPCKTLKARELWDQIAYAAWSCADPGVQFDTTINEWHTCPADGRINAVKPVLRIHVPRRHRLQPGIAEPAQVLTTPRRHASTSIPSAMPAASGR